MRHSAMLFLEKFRPHIFTLGTLLFFLTPFFSFAQSGGATYSLSPSSGSYAVGKTFTVSVIAESSATFNSANATLNFDKNALSVTNVSKSNSAFSLWAVEPSSSNSAGTVNFEGGNTTPLSGKKTLLEITFKPLKEGDTEVTFGSGSILAADGKGTDILGEKRSATFTIKAGGLDNTPKNPAPATDSGALGPVPDAPEIVSPTHPSETAYANAPKAKFTWELPPDVTVIRMTLDSSEKTIPTTNIDPAVSEKEYELPQDGVMYFHLRYKNDTGWGPTTHRKILIDKTPPPDFTLKVVPDASSTDVNLIFSATDTLSQLDRYEVSVDDGKGAKIPLIEVKPDGWILSDQEPGNHTVKITAFDKAGNSTSAEGKFTIAGGEVAKTTGDEAEAKPIDWRLIADILLIAIIAFLIGYLWYERNAFHHEKFMIKREADELRDSMGNIFAAVREEVGEQVGRLFQKPNPSAQDRETMQSINEAVDLSEELLSKEVEDVRKLLS